MSSLVLAGLLIPALSRAQSITLQGRVLDASNQPLSGNVSFRVKILTPDASRCVLYDETQVLDLTASSGLFSIRLNDGSGTLNLPNTYTLTQALSNRTAFSINSGYCQAGAGIVNYTPANDSDRKVLISFKDTLMASFEDMPEMTLTPSASTLEAQTVGGFPSSSLLRVETAGSPGTVAALSSTDFSEIQSLVGGTSTKYMNYSTSTGTRIPPMASAPASPSAGTIWFDSGTSTLKYYDGTSAQTLGTSTSSGDITGVTAGTGLSGGGTSGAVTLNLANTAVTAGSYGSASQVPVLTVDAQGRITAASTVAVSAGGGSPTGAAGGDLSGTYPNPGVAKIRGVAVGTGTPTAGQVLKYGTDWSPAAINLADLKSTVAGSLFDAPNCDGSETLTWNSVSDQFSCQSIALDASAITAGTLGAARLPSSGVTAGTYKSVTVDATGRVSAGTNPTTLSGYGITDSVQNAGTVPSIASGLDASKPAAGTAGRLYIATDTFKFYRDSGATWEEISPAGTASGDITGVTAGTGLSGGGTSGAVTLNLADTAVSAGSYGSNTQVATFTVDAQGRLTSAGNTTISGVAPGGSAGGDLSGTYPNPTLTASGVTAGTYKSVTVDAKGRVTAGTNPTTLSGYGITDSVQNAGTVPSIASGLDASKPAAGTAGRIYIATDTLKTYRDNGTTWDTLSSASGGAPGGSAGGDLTGTFPNPTLTTSGVTAGTYRSVTVDAKGRVTAGTSPTTIADYGLTDAVKNDGSVPSLKSGTDAAKPAAGTAGRLYISTDTFEIYRDNGTTWDKVASAAGSGGDITGVTAGTGLSGGGTSGAVTVNLANTAVTAGSYGSATKVPSYTVDAQGRITAASEVTITGTTPGGSAGGDLSGTYPNPTVAKIQGSAVASTTPTSGQFLRYGTNWSPAGILLSDLKSSVAGNLFSSPNCTAAQTLTWNSVSDQFSCQSIDGLDGAAIDSGTIAAARLPASITDGAWSASSGNVYRSSGSVGIGTASPNWKLNVAGGGASILSTTTDYASGTTGSSIGIYHGANTGNTYSALQAGVSGGASTGTLALQPNGGNVGIGTNSPVGPGAIGANLKVIRTSSNWGLVVESGASVPQADILLHHSGGTADSRITQLVAGSDKFLLRSLKDDATVKSYFLSADLATGNLGIGNITAGTLLDVNGAITTRPLGTAAGETGQVVFRELAANGTNAFTIKAPDALTANRTWVLPESAGSASQVLTTDGSGNLSWSAPGGATTVDAQDGSAASPSIKFSNDSNTGLYSAGADILGFSTNGTARMTLSNAALSSVTSSGPALNLQGTDATTPSFSFNGDSNTGIFSPGADSIALSTGGTERLRVDSSGNIGIGKTNPSHKLDVNGVVRATALITDGATPSPSTAHSSMRVSGALRWAFGLQGAESTGNAGSDYAFWTYDDSGTFLGNPLTIQRSTGNVGVGTSTPNTKLEIKGASGISSFTNSSFLGLMLGGATPNTTQYTGIDFAFTGAVKPQARIAANFNSSGSTISLGTTNDYSSGVNNTAMTINNVGNVGIGTVSPGRRLQVESDGSESSNYTGIGLKNSGAGGGWWEFLSGNTANSMAGKLSIYDRGQSAHRLVIDSTGNVGLGTTTPGDQLHVSGANPFIRLDSAAGNTDAGLAFYRGGASKWSIRNNGNDDGLYFTSPTSADADTKLAVLPSGNVGIGTTTPGYKLDVSGDLRITGTPYRTGGDIAWQVPSDSRLKDVKGSYERGLDSLSQLDVIRFRYKKDNPVGADSTKEYTGVLAQDARKVFPESVTEDAKTGFLSLNTTPIFWALVNAVKDLHKRLLGIESRQVAQGRNIDSLASKAEMKAQLKAKDKEIAELRALVEKQKKETTKNLRELDAVKEYICAKDVKAKLCNK